MTTLAEPTTQTDAPPVQPLAYENEQWECPITGTRVPKDLKSHLDWRGEVWKECAKSFKLRDIVWNQCKESPILFINLFGATYKFKDVDEHGRETAPQNAHAPFITWPCQDTALQELADSIPKRPGETGRNVLIDKSRDMGASWLIVEMAVWLWLFWPDTRGTMASTNADYVDKTGSPLALFFKIDYQIQMTPWWMLPLESTTNDEAVEEKQKKFSKGQAGSYRQLMQLTNPKNGATISGFATTDNIGRGDRANYVLMDEMATIPGAADAWRAAADTTPCRIANSTPVGPGTKYSQLYQQGLRTGSPKIIGLYYYDHPEKGQNREVRVDETGEITQQAGRVYWWTPWFEQRRLQDESDPQDIAQNVLADHVTSGTSIFNEPMIYRHIQKHAKDPMRAEMVVGEDRAGRESVWFNPDDQGRWYLWCELDAKGKPVNQQTNYVMFADPAYGTGAANAACSVMDRETGEVIAEYVDPYTPPQDLAYQMCKAGKHLFRGQARHAFIGWEKNGPGESMHYDVLRMDYPFIYFRRQIGSRNERATKKYGWWSDRSTKRLLCTELNKAMQRGEITVRSSPALNEMLEYVFYDDGSIGPGNLRDEHTGAREAHGDRCIALAGCVLLRKEAPVFQPETTGYRPEQLGAIAEHDTIDEGEDEHDAPELEWWEP